MLEAAVGRHPAFRIDRRELQRLRDEMRKTGYVKDYIAPRVTKDGRLSARECQVYMDTGAYADAGPRVTQKAGYRSLGPYNTPYAKVEAYGVYTNSVPAGAFRGFGALHDTRAYESQIDMISDPLGVDPMEFRHINLLQEGEAYTDRGMTVG